MIKIERGTPPRNTVLDRKKEGEYQKIKEKLQKKSKSIKFKPLWSDEEVKQFLHDAQHGKCCYCERKRDRKREIDVEHFRPKGEVDENSEHPGYWWLAYEWDNLLLACKACNEEVKKAKFPIKDELKRAFKRTDDLDREAPYLINPLKENPEDFIEYEIPESDLEDIETDKPLPVLAVGKDERGEKTVNELTAINMAINSDSVPEERGAKLRETYGILLKAIEKKGLEREKYEKYINRFISSGSEFSGFARFYFKSKGYL